MTWLKCLLFVASISLADDYLFITENQVKDSLPYSLEILFEKIGRYQKFQADYTQRKQLPKLKKALQSSGVFLFEKKRGIEFRQEQPIKQITWIGTDAIQITDAQGKITTVGSKSDPWASNMSQLISDLFHGNAKALMTQFDLWYEADASRILLGIKPKSLITRRFLESITLVFVREKLQTLTLKENSQALTTWEFKNQK